jgi:HK97 family phage major capsid protein
MNTYLSRAMARDHSAFIAKVLSGARYERKEGETPIVEIKKLLNDQGSAFEEFKKTNDAIMAAKADGKAVGELTEKLAKLNGELDRVGADIKAATTRFDKLETVLSRHPSDSKDTKALDAEVKAFNVALKAHAGEYGRPAPVEMDAEGYTAYKSGFRKFILKGDRDLTEGERKAMSVGSDPDGGYVVTPDITGQIATKIYETSDVRRLASVQTISTDALEGMIDKDTGTNAGWTSETGTRSQSGTPQLGKWRIPVHEQYAQPIATQKLLDDAAINVEEWLAGKTADYMSRVENTAFVSGDGAGKPFGFTSYTTAATADTTRGWGTMEHLATGTNASLGTGINAANNLISLIHKVKTGYRGGASWAMNRTTVGIVRQLVDGSGRYIWLPSMDALQPSSLLGYPVAEFQDMADVAGTAVLPVAFGNFKLCYQIVDRQGIRVLRDPIHQQALRELLHHEACGRRRPQLRGREVHQELVTGHLST